MRSNTLSDNMAARLPSMVVILLSVGVIGRHPADDCRQQGGTCAPHRDGCQHTFWSGYCHHHHGHTHLCCVQQHPVTHATTDASAPKRTQAIQYSSPSQCGTRVFAEHILGRRIVGGSRSVTGEWPWQVYITYDGKSACSGVIIANTWVLTVAHCIQHTENPGRYMVRAGEYNTKAYDGTEQYYSVHKILIHPEFNMVTGQNDIALMRINGQFAFNNNVRAICLPTSANSGTNCVVTGWGETHGNQDSGYLKKASVAMVPLAKCRTDYASIDYPVFDNNLCASGGGNDACEGDSGGPLACHEQGVWHLRGLVSWGKQCGDGIFPGVYTRVYSYIHWIHNIIN